MCQDSVIEGKASTAMWLFCFEWGMSLDDDLGMW